MQGRREGKKTSLSYKQREHDVHPTNEKVFIMVMEGANQQQLGNQAGLPTTHLPTASIRLCLCFCLCLLSVGGL